MSDMVYRPILFSGPMIKAILEGRKTQTRRALDRNKQYGPFAFDDPRVARYCPYGQPGTVLYVRETHAIVPWTAYAFSEGVQQTQCPYDPHDAAIYKAGWDRSPPTRWRPSIHMKRWAARIFLEITDVRVERLETISEADVIAEGFELGGEYWYDNFRAAWNQINGKKHPWRRDSSPWVWVISFRRIEVTR